MRLLEATGALPLGHVEILRFAQDDKHRLPVRE
jgi:hypothetical protein